MKNKILLIVVILLLPLALFLNNNKENDNNLTTEDNYKKEKLDIEVYLNYNNKELKLDINDYLIGVVGMEMPASFNDEALKAQAIASRSFALSNMTDNKIVTNTVSQSYADNEILKEKWGVNYDTYYKKIKDAVMSTDGLVMKYNNNIIKSYYFSMSNGKTEDVKEVFNEDLPYLKSVDSSFEENTKNFEVETSFNYKNFCDLLSIIDCSYIKIDNIEKDDSGRISKITINNKEYSGINIRKLLSLRSTDFEINISDQSIIIKTKGYGHGVGMSQYGANYLANIGKNYEEILKYYYNGIDIENY